MTIQLERLRCTHCGAPLPKPSQGENYIKCEYCGFVNRLTDTSAYIERLKEEVAKWLSQILPRQTIVSTTADPLARYHIFQAYIKPNLIVINTNSRSTYIQVTHRSLLNFTPVYQVECTESPRSLFERSVLVDTVSELAVADDDKAFLDDTRRYILAQAYICNALKDAIEEKYTESVKNIDEAIALVEVSGDKPLVQRLRVAKTVYTAISEIYSRNPTAALNLLIDAERLVRELIDKKSDPLIAKYLPALEIELDLVRLLKTIAETSESSFRLGSDPLSSFVYIKNVLHLVVNNIRTYNKSIKEIVEVAEYVKKMIQSRLGMSRVKVIGDGDLFVPFYVVSSNITYTTGLLFKKGQETKVNILVSASPPIFNSITDVFEIYTGRQVNIEKEQDTVRIISNLLSNTRVDALRAKAIPPLITPSIADIVAERYLDAVRSRYSGKIKLSTTHVDDIIYVGLRTDNRQLRSPIPISIFSVDWNKISELAF